MTLRKSSAISLGDEARLAAALLGEERCVDVRDRVLGDVGEQALEGGELPDRHVVLGDLATHVDVELHGDRAGEGREDPAELLDEVDAGAHLLGDRAAGDVDGIRHEVAAEREAHRPRHGDTGLLLGLVGRRAEVGRHDDRLVGEERAVGARLLGEHVDAGAGDATLGDGVGEGLLVEHAAAGGVDDAHGRLDLGERLLADEADRLGGLREVDRDEVALGEQLVEGDEAGAELAGALHGDVGVVGEDLDAEALEPLGDELADAAEADDADLLLEELDPAVLAALPGAVLQRLVGRGDVARAGEEQPDGELGGGGDVRGGGVDDHDAGLGGGLDVDVVEPDTRAGDDLEVLRGTDGLGVHLRGGADEHRVDAGEGREELVAVGPVDLAHLEVRAEGVDGRGRELLGDEDDGLGHETVPLSVLRSVLGRSAGCRCPGGRGPSPGPVRALRHAAGPGPP